MRATRLVRVLMAGVALVMATAWLPGAPAGALPIAPVITGYPDAAVGTPNAAFSFFAPDADGYQCRTFATGTPEGSRPAYTACSGGSAGTHVVTGRADGSWTLEVAATDEDGPGPSATHDWIVTSDPVVQWVSEPTGTHTSRYVTATFTAAGATGFQCRLDSEAFAACGSGSQGYWASPGLEEGPHTLQVRATDGSGFGPVASAAFTVDGDLPVTWVSRPTGSYSSRYVTATFTAAGATSFQCRVHRTDPVPDPLPEFSPCGSGRQGVWTSDGLDEGSYRLEVRGHDDLTGPDGGDVASTEFTVDGQLPTSWVSRPTGTYRSRYVTATFAAAGAGAHVCRSYRTDPAPDPLPEFSPCGSGQQGMWESPTLADGLYRLEVRGQDGLTGYDANQGGTIVSTEFEVDVPLTVEWIARPQGTIGGPGVSATFAADGATSFECRLGTDDWSTCGSGSEGTWTGYPTLGAHDLSVRALDGTGTGATASTSFTTVAVSGTPLAVQVTSGPGEGSVIGSSAAAFSFAAPGAACLRVELDGADDNLSNAFCYDPVANPSVAAYQSFANLADGPHVLRVQARSAGGAVGPLLRRTFTVDTTGLTTVEVTSGPAEGSTIGSSWAAFSFAAPGAACLRVELDGADDDLSNAFCYDPVANPSVAAYQSFANLADGPHVLRVQARSTGGSDGPLLEHTFTVGTGSLATVEVTSGPAEGSTIGSSWAAFSFAAPGAACLRVELDGADDDLSNAFCYDPVANPSVAAYQSFANLADGPHVLRVQARSTGGSDGPLLEHTFTVDTTALTTVEVTSGPAEGSTIGSSWAALSFAAPGAACLRVELDGADDDLSNAFCYDPVANPNVAAYQSFANLADGPHVLRVQARSTGGSDGPLLEHTFTVRAGPLPLISSRPRQVLPAGAAAFAFHAPGAACVRVELDGIDDDLSNAFCYDPVANPNVAAYQSFANLSDGPHVLRVQARSSGGSFGPVVASTFVVETKDPETTIASGPPAHHASTGPTFTFTSDEPSTFQCRLDAAAAFTSCPTPWTPTGLAEGPHTVQVRAVDGFGNVDATPDTWSWTVDTVAPTVIDLTGPTGTITNPDAAFTYDADESPVTFECRVLPRDTEFEPCSTTHSEDDLPDGAYRFEVRARDLAGNISNPAAHREWTVLTDAPDTEITAGPPAIVGSTSASISFTSPDPGVTYQCSLDGAAYATCTSPRALSGLPDGIRTFLVRAVAAGVLPDPTPARHEWIVDTVAPTITITSAPDGTVGVDGSTFTFTTSEPASVTCELDGAAPAACTSPRDLGALPGGDHTLVLRATDLAGNPSLPVTHTWTVDDVAPIATITAGPDVVTDETSATVTFTLDDASASTECSLDGGAWTPCTGSFTRTGLSDGAHVVQVRATDPAGNTGPDDSHPWTVDTVDPVVLITSAPTGTIATTAGTVTFTVTDATATTAECSVDLGPWVTCSSPFAFSVTGQGLHSISVRATDLADNTSPAESRTWTVDTIGPVVTITGGPTGTVGVDDASITFTVDDPGPGVVVRCRLDGGAAQVCTSPVAYDGLANGAHLVEIWGTDAVGNQGPIAPRPWIVDTAEPETTITSAPLGLTNQSDTTVTFTSDIAGSTFECRLDGGPWQSCTSPRDLGELADGEHRFEVVATANGLTDPTPAVEEWEIDTVVPVVTLTHVPPTQSREVDSHVDFTVDDATATVECRLDGGAWSACSSPFAPPVADGSHTVDVRARDAAGNVGTAGPVTWVADSVGPAVVITSGPLSGAVVTTRGATFTFTVDDPTATVQCRLVPDAWGPCSGAGTHTLTGLADGSYTFQVRAVDAAGNEGATGRTFTVDATAPTVTITSGPPEATAATGAAVAFTVDDPTALLECRVDGGAWQPCDASPVELTGLAEGPHSVAVRGTDVNGLEGVPATWAWVVDVTAPTVVITDGPDGTVSTDDVTFAFEADEPATFECRLDDGEWDACASPHDVDDLPVGEHTFRVRATDAAGHRSEEARRDFTVELPGDPFLEVGVRAQTSELAPLTTTGIGDDFRMRVTVANTGEAASDDTVLTVPLGSGLRTVGALPGRCTAPGPTGPVTCDLGSIAAGATVAVAIRVEAVLGCTRWGSSADDEVVLGTAGADVLCGGGGADEIRGRGGVDLVYGDGPSGSVSTGASVVYGAGGSSSASAPTAPVIPVTAVDGGDTITTGAQADVVWGQGGADVITTGGGSDDVDGGEGGDVIDTGSGPSRVSGGAGDDTVTGGTSVDTVDGGDGSDTVDAGTGPDVVRGGAGDDPALLGGEGDDLVEGGPGNDVVDGHAGRDTIRGGDGDDTVRGGDGNDHVVDGEGGHDSVDAGLGSDPAVRGGAGNDIVLGGAGNDDVRGGDGDDPQVDGGAGLDTVNGDGGADHVLGGTEVDTVHGGPGDDVVRGGDGSDTTVHGGDGRDQVFGDGGNDPFVYGGEGDDHWVDGGTGVDRVFGGLGDDVVHGGAGNDVVVNGEEGADWVYGDDGNDPLVLGAEGDDHVVDGGLGKDEVYGGVGSDVVRGGAGDDVAVNGQEGADWVYGDDGNDPFVTGGIDADHLVDGGAGSDRVFGDAGGDDPSYADTVHGGLGDDVIGAGWGADVVDGGSGHDVIDAGPGSDIADGGAGNDRVVGGNGLDTLRGGAGADVLEGSEDADELFGGSGDDDLDGGVGESADRLYGEDGNDILLGRAGEDHMLGGAGHDYMDGGDGNDYLNGQTGRDVLRGNAGDDELDGGPAALGPLDAPGDHWNRLYGDAGTQDVCHYGPGTVEDRAMTSYRDASCELRDAGVPQPGLGWRFGSRDRLDRGRLDPATYPG